MMEAFEMVGIPMRYLVMDKDRHDNARYYVRKPGSPKIRIRAEVGSPEFTEAYHAAIAGKGGPAKLEQIPETCFQYLVQRYYASTEFKSELGGETQKVRMRILNGLCKSIGHLPYKRIEERHVREWMDARSDRPEAANGLLKSLRGLFKFAKARQFIAKNPLTEISRVKTAGPGFHTWTIQEVRQFEACHPIGTKARLILSIAMFLGMRRGDISIIGRQHVQDGLIVFRPAKSIRNRNPRTLHLPILPVLREVFEATPTGNMTFITTRTGKPYTKESLGALFREYCDEAKLFHCALHGLRKAGAVIAAENGATDRQLMAIFGWAKADMATLYTEQADRKKQAAMGMETLVPRTKETTESVPVIQWADIKKAGTARE